MKLNSKIIAAVITLPLALSGVSACAHNGNSPLVQSQEKEKEKQDTSKPEEMSKAEVEPSAQVIKDFYKALYTPLTKEQQSRVDEKTQNPAFAQAISGLIMGNTSDIKPETIKELNAVLSEPNQEVINLTNYNALDENQKAIFLSNVTASRLQVAQNQKFNEKDNNNTPPEIKVTVDTNAATVNAENITFPAESVEVELTLGKQSGKNKANTGIEIQKINGKLVINIKPVVEDLMEKMKKLRNVATVNNAPNDKSNEKNSDNKDSNPDVGEVVKDPIKK